ncbi:MAG: biosynthetic-type acetolactate synthase large subunit [Armatimonadetes bacterium]|nr:biosynthetic-type acetolactate synthase large subunit [Armatimonadota bacterium]PIU65156.1 MAG: acetolactate synthase, large subunit, biosynthetic type [Armatimonadetes bacterium CG07_land_8_20_14_0_80_59_28]PIX45255.1 MAG: acetolactate synthase, large subunit, biosynthetic type [Armatimonadetes bacterium CG_4_8_14_3_um_filter_58_9]PIY38120.1 MAG: acetolactate synthase, large subunit, biosynthetic type [Armatimonadetes bacterium CG_4_10_14_3_um_filter_59_10]
MGKQMSGAQALVESLVNEGVSAIFGLPGGANMPIYDALYQHPTIKHYLVRNEQGAAFMAEGYARSTGKVGVAMATSGPGATNLITGIADAYMDSIPLICITGQVPTHSLGTDAFQEADVRGITMPIVKHSYLIGAAEDVPLTIREAFHIAHTGRPGPVVIDIPKDAQIDEIDYEYPPRMSLRGYQPPLEADAQRIDEAARHIADAERPVLYIGGGAVASECRDELLQLAERLHSPVVCSLMAKGIFPEAHPLALGMPGMHGSAYANFALNGADLLLAVGTRFDDRVTGKISEFAKLACIIHIDVDPAELGKVVQTHVKIAADAKAAIKQLLATVKPKNPGEWLQQIDEWKTRHPLKRKKTDRRIGPDFILQRINEVTKGEAIVTTDVGQHQMWAAQYIACKYPRHFLTSGGLGAMGFGFPAAMGAKVAWPEKSVVCVSGDGSFQMNIQELNTGVNNKLAVVVAILNNGFLGMVRQWQGLFFDRRYSAVDLSDNPEFVKIAEAYGAKGRVVETEKDVVPALEEALAEQNVPTILDFRTEPEADVFPMIPSGQTVREIMFDDAS